MLRKRRNYKTTRGYTLVEMLVVVAIIAILLGLAATAMKRMATAEGVNAGVPIAKAKFNEAKQLALGRGARTRVAILAGAGGDSLKKNAFSYMAIFVENGGDWEQVGDAEQLPANCYFFTDSAADSVGSKGFTTVSMPFDDIGSQSAHVYTFSPIGYPVLDETSRVSDVTDSSAQLVVLTSGRISGTAVVSDAKPDRAGFALSSYGNILDVEKKALK